MPPPPRLPSSHPVPMSMSMSIPTPHPVPPTTPFVSLYSSTSLSILARDRYLYVPAVVRPADLVSVQSSVCLAPHEPVSWSVHIRPISNELHKNLPRSHLLAIERASELLHLGLSTLASLSLSPNPHPTNKLVVPPQSTSRPGPAALRRSCQRPTPPTCRTTRS